ncbi:MAG: response regulator, partial [Myxococcales bacterium]
MGEYEPGDLYAGHAAAPGEPVTPHTILVVDDNPTTRKVVCVALANRGHRVLEAPDGRSALELVVREQPALVLQDLVLPDVDGFALVAELRKRSRNQVAVLALCGFRSRSDEARISAVGFDDIVVKPIDPAGLIPVVEAYLPLTEVRGERFGAGKRLVLADDDPAQLKLTAFRLEKLGFLVQTARDGREAIALIMAEPPDVIVSDVLMPTVDGFGVALAIRQDPRLASVPLLLVTSSYVDEGDRDFARRAGASDLVLRTPEQRELVEALRNLLAHPPAGATLGVAALPDLEKERTERMVRQLERHVVMNAGLARRCSSLAAELAVLAGISDAVLKDQNTEHALEVALASCFDAGGIAMGGLYLLEPDGGFRARPLGTTVTWKPDDLPSFFGDQALLRQIISGGTTVILPSTRYADESVRAMLRRSGGSAAMVVPLAHSGHAIGALLMIA